MELEDFLVEYQPMNKIGELRKRILLQKKIYSEEPLLDLIKCNDKRLLFLHLPDPYYDVAPRALFYDIFPQAWHEGPRPKEKRDTASGCSVGSRVYIFGGKDNSSIELIEFN